MGQEGGRRTPMPATRAMSIVEDAVVEDRGDICAGVARWSRHRPLHRDTTDKVKFDARNPSRLGPNTLFPASSSRSPARTGAKGERRRRCWRRSFLGSSGGEVYLGAARSRGLGKVKLEGLTILERKFDSRDGILASLRGTAQPSEQLEALFTGPWKDHRTQKRHQDQNWLAAGQPNNGQVGRGWFGCRRSASARPEGRHPSFCAPRLLYKGSVAVAGRAHRCNAARIRQLPNRKRSRCAIVAIYFGAPKCTRRGNKEKEWLPGLSPLSMEDCFSKSKIGAQTLDRLLSGDGPGEGGKDLPN